MKKYTLYTSLLFLLITISCKNKTNNVPINEHKIQSMLWQQNAAEYRALCYQAFNFAKLRLDDILENQKADKPFAIIADIKYFVRTATQSVCPLNTSRAKFFSESFT